MDDDVVEIDLSRIMRLVLSEWRWIILFAICPALIVFLYFFFFQPRLYEAKALISLTKPRYLLNFDPQYQTLQTSGLTNKVAVDIALSGEIINQVYEAWSNPQKRPGQADDFRRSYLEVKTGGDASIVVLIVRLESAEEAARLANLWAELVVDKINTIYSEKDIQQLSLIESQLEEAKAELQKADQTLAAFEARNPSRALQNQLDVLVSVQRALLLQQNLIRQWQQEAQHLLEEIDETDNAVLSMDFYTRWVVLALNVQNINSLIYTYRNDNVEMYPSPYQLQMPILSANGLPTVAEFRRSVQSWQNTLDAQLTFIEGQLKAYPDNLFALQEQIENLNREKQRLTLERTVANDTVETLNRKYQELRISIQNKGDARIASKALPPSVPKTRNTLTYTLVALLGGAVLGTAFVLLRGWWRQGAISE